MRVDGSIDPNKPDVAGVSVKRNGNGSGSPSTPLVSDVDKVALSETGRRLASARASDGGADIRSEKVDAVRAAIESGQFRVDAQKVADKLITEAAQLLETIVVDKPE